MRLPRFFSYAVLLGLPPVAARLALGFVAVAVLTAHLHWQYPAQQQPLQWIFLSKDIAIAGGILILFVAGGGRYSIDAKLTGK